MVYDYQILKLTDDFYKAYPDPPFHEILQKKDRAYDCLLFQTHYHYFICVPYRTEISHAYAFHFTKSRRSKKHRSGLDYSRMVIIQNPVYINNESAVIDDDEYVETVLNIERIQREAVRFLEDYCAHVTGACLMHEREFQRRYRFSPLKYFHSALFGSSVSGRQETGGRREVKQMQTF